MRRLLKIIEANIYHYYYRFRDHLDEIAEKRILKDANFYLKYVKICKKYEYPEVLTEVVLPKLPEARCWSMMPAEPPVDLGHTLRYYKKEVRYVCYDVDKRGGAR